MTSDDAILAYVDGELDAARAAALEAAMAADPQLAARVADHRALREAAAGAFAGLLAEPVPDRLRIAVLADPKVVRPDFARSRPALPRWAAIAASLVVGVLVGQGVALLNRGPLASGADGLEARGALAGALTGQMAGEGTDIRLGVSFRDASGDYCRTFLVRRQALAGIACRGAGRWNVRLTAQAAEQVGDYRMAASAMPQTVLSAMDQMMVGEPLDHAGEEAARAAGWARR